MMIAFHGDAGVKEKYLARVRGHRAADDTGSINDVTFSGRFELRD